MRYSVYMSTHALWKEPQEEGSVNRCIARPQGVNPVARPALRQRAQGVKHRFLAPRLGNANEYIFISLALCRQ